jgi:hypothetical protein
VLLRALLPAGAPGALERGREPVEVAGGAEREEVGDAVDGGGEQPGRGRAREAEQGEHAVDVDEQDGPSTATLHDLAR